jgi:hypothetical protein
LIDGEEFTEPLAHNFNPQQRLQIAIGPRFEAALGKSRT